MEQNKLSSSLLGDLMEGITPGEWIGGKKNNFEYVDIDANGERICSVYTGIESNPRAEADAQLIALSPSIAKELLQARKEIEELKSDLSRAMETAFQENKTNQQLLSALKEVTFLADTYLADPAIETAKALLNK